MGIAAFLCIFVGTFPKVFLYPMLPNIGTTYEPYTVAHVTDQYALLLFSALAFTLLMRAGLYPAEIRSTNIDTDWFYRKGGGVFYRLFDRTLNGANQLVHQAIVKTGIKKLGHFLQHGPARFVAVAMTPIWLLHGAEGEELQDKQQAFYERARWGAFPVGATAVCAVILLALLFLF
jgi:multicomponent Na+:H+ antiporter subunit D